MHPHMSEGVDTTNVGSPGGRHQEDGGRRKHSLSIEMAQLTANSSSLSERIEQIMAAKLHWTRRAELNSRGLTRDNDVTTGFRRRPLGALFIKADLIYIHSVCRDCFVPKQRSECSGISINDEEGVHNRGLHAYVNTTGLIGTHPPPPPDGSISDWKSQTS